MGIIDLNEQLNQNKEDPKISYKAQSEEKFEEIVQIIEALSYLRKESKRKNNKMIYLLINSVFTLCVLTHEDVFKREDVQSYEAYKKFVDEL